MEPTSRVHYRREEAQKDLATEEDGAAIGRIRMRTIADASGDSLMAFVGESIEPGSVVHTDGWLGYEPLERHGIATK